MAPMGTDPPGEGLAILQLVPVCHSRVVTRTRRGLEFTVKHSKKSAAVLVARSRCLCSCADERDSTLAPAGSFVSREAMPLLLSAL